MNLKHLKFVGIDWGINDLATTSAGRKFCINNLSHVFHAMIDSTDTERNLEAFKDVEPNKPAHSLKKKELDAKITGERAQLVEEAITKEIRSVFSALKEHLMKYDIIGIEDLSDKKIKAKRGKPKGNTSYVIDSDELIKSIEDCLEKRDGVFKQFLNHIKFYDHLDSMINFLRENNKKVYMVNRYNTSKTCSVCGVIGEYLCSKKIFYCPECFGGLKRFEDKDINAAQNMRLGAVNRFFDNRKTLLQHYAGFNQGEREWRLKENENYRALYLGVPSADRLLSNSSYPDKDDFLIKEVMDS